MIESYFSLKSGPIRISYLQKTWGLRAMKSICLKLNNN